MTLSSRLLRHPSISLETRLLDGFPHAQDMSLCKKKTTPSTSGLSKCKPHGISDCSLNMLERNVSGSSRITRPMDMLDQKPHTHLKKLMDSPSRMETLAVFTTAKMASLDSGKMSMLTFLSGLVLSIPTELLELPLVSMLLVNLRDGPLRISLQPPTKTSSEDHAIIQSRS